MPYRMLLGVMLVVGCSRPSTSSEPEPEAIQPVETQPAEPVVEVGEGTIRLNGQSIDTALDPTDERRIPALYDALPEHEQALSVVVATSVTWRPVRRVLLTAQDKGMARFWLSTDGGPRRGPLHLPAAQQAPAGPTVPLPVALLRVHQSQQVWLDGEVRFRGERPVDCSAIYADAPVLQQACVEGGAVGPAPLGCLTPPLAPAEAAVTWGPSLAESLQRMGADQQWAWVVVADIGVGMTVLDTVLDAVLQTGSPSVALGGASPTRGQAASCAQPPPSADDLALQGARWAGSGTE